MLTERSDFQIVFKGKEKKAFTLCFSHVHNTSWLSPEHDKHVTELKQYKHRLEDA